MENRQVDRYYKNNLTATGTCTRYNTRTRIYSLQKFSTGTGRF